MRSSVDGAEELREHCGGVTVLLNGVEPLGIPLSLHLLPGAFG